MELGLSKEEIIEQWNGAVQSATPEGQAAAKAALRAGGKVPVMETRGQAGSLDDLQLALVSFVNNVVRLNNRRIQEQLEKAGFKLE